MDTNTVVTPVSDNPYVGPRPFLPSESNRFFGRDHEANLLIPLVITERLLLFYAQSGAGKSSLLNARLIPGLQQRNFITLYGRVTGSNATIEEVKNIYVYNLLLSLTPEKQESGAGDVEHLKQMTLKEFLANLDVGPARPPETPADTPLDAPQVIGGVQPLALIIDQAEEIFTTHPEAWKLRGPFLEQLREALEADPYLWIIISIREDYIAHLAPYGYLLPGQLRNRFYMQRMRVDAAIEAVTKPVENIRPFVMEDAQALVKALSQIAVGKDQNGETIYADGEFIEPVQLQVVCYQLWESLRNFPGDQITMQDLERIAQGQSLAGFIVQALRKFYEDTLHSVLQDLAAAGHPLPERKLRDWFSKELITGDGTRASVFRSGATTGTLPNEAVDLLVQRFIIRAEVRAGGRWYELVHDQLIQPILRSNMEWQAANTTKLEKDAQQWKVDRDPARLYSGKQLKDALDLQAHGELNDDEDEFVRESSDESERKSKAARRQRQLLIASVIAALVFIVVALFALAESSIAYRNGVEAENQRSTAVAASTQAISQQFTAVAAGKQAEAAMVQAETQKSTAVAALNAEKIADQQTLYNRLAAFSKYYIGDNLDLSLLFGVASYKVARSAGEKLPWEAMNALHAALWSAYNDSPFDVLVDPFQQPLLTPQDGVFALDFRPDGSQLVTGGNAGTIHLWDLTTGDELPVPQGLDSNNRIYAIKFSPSGQVIAVGSGDGTVKFWDVQKNTLLDPFRPTGPAVYVHALAFDPSSKYLAIGMGNGHVILYDLLKQSVVTTLAEPSGDIWSIAWSPDGSRLAYGGKDGRITVWNMASQSEENKLTNALRSTVQGLAWSTDGQSLYAGGQDKVLIHWNLADNSVSRSRKEDSVAIFSLAMHPGGSVLVSGNGDVDHPVVLWDARTLARVGEPDANHGWVRAVAFDQKGKFMASGGDDFRTYVWKIISLDPLGKLALSLPGATTASAGISANGKLVLLRRVDTGAQQTLQLLDGSTQQSLGSPYPVKYEQLALFNHKGRLELALASAGSVTFVNPANGKALDDEPIMLTADGVRALAVDQDGKTLGVVQCKVAGDAPASPGAPPPCHTSSLKFWNLETHQQITLLDLQPEVDLDVTGLGIDRGGLVVLGLSDGDITFASLNEALALGSNLRPTSASSSGAAVTTLSFSPDGNTFFTATTDGDLQMWDTTTRKFIGDMGTETGDGIIAAAYSNDASGFLHLYAATQQGKVRDWDIDPASWIARSCQLVGHDMTQEDWTQHFHNIPKPVQICP